MVLRRGGSSAVGKVTALFDELGFAPEPVRDSEGWRILLHRCRSTPLPPSSLRSSAGSTWVCCKARSTVWDSPAGGPPAALRCTRSV